MIFSWQGLSSLSRFRLKHSLTCSRGRPPHKAPINSPQAKSSSPAAVTEGTVKARVTVATTTANNFMMKEIEEWLRGAGVWIIRSKTRSMYTFHRRLCKRAREEKGAERETHTHTGRERKVWKVHFCRQIRLGVEENTPGRTPSTCTHNVTLSKREHLSASKCRDGVPMYYWNLPFRLDQIRVPPVVCGCICVPPVVCACICIPLIMRRLIRVTCARDVMWLYDMYMYTLDHTY